MREGDRDFQLHYARVLLGEARKRRGPFAHLLLNAAHTARKRASDLAGMGQGELFSRSVPVPFSRGATASCNLQSEVPDVITA